MFLWKFKVEGYEATVGKYKHEGLTCGDSFSDAVEGLEKWYGDEIMGLYIEPATDDDGPYLFNSKYEDGNDHLTVQN